MDMDDKDNGSAVSPEEPSLNPVDPSPDDDAAVSEKACRDVDDDDVNGDGDDDDDDDPETSNEGDGPSDGDTPTSPDDLLLQAMTHKDDGNAFFKSGEFASSARCYRKGTKLLKSLNEGNSGDDQVKQLLITMQTNLSMVCFRQQKHKMSRDVASKALDVDSKNVKALYRRAIAARAMGDVEAARMDLKLALKGDPENVAVKKELMVIKKKIEEEKAKEKARLRKAFSKASGRLLYNDKEEEEKRKAKEKKELQKKKAELKEKRMRQWEEENVRRKSSEEEPISFEEWDKEQKKQEEEEEKARKKAKKEEEKRKREERRKREAQKVESDDEELTEKELAMLRGYKKTSDGRTTSYFNREQSEEEKKMIGCIKPKRLESIRGSTVLGTPALVPASPSPSLDGGGGGVGSAWNAGGSTWEEKNTTDWCKKCLKKCILDADAAYCPAASSEAYVAVVKKVEKLTGDASVAIAGGRKRYIYDFHLTLEYEILDDGDKRVACGTLNLPDVNSATAIDEDELEVDCMGWKESPKGDGLHVIECRNVLVREVRKSVLRFVEKFNASF